MDVYDAVERSRRGSEAKMRRQSKKESGSAGKVATFKKVRRYFSGREGIPALRWNAPVQREHDRRHRAGRTHPAHRA